AGPLAVAGDEQVLRRAVKEPRQPLGLLEPPLAQPFEEDPEGLLVEVLRQGRIAGRAPQHVEQAPAVALDQLGLGRGAARRGPAASTRHPSRPARAPRNSPASASVSQSVTQATSRPPPSLS